LKGGSIKHNKIRIVLDCRAASGIGKEESVMRKPIALISALMLSAPVLSGCVDMPPTTPQVVQVQTQNLGLTGAMAWRYSRDQCDYLR
jgi:hypothetical protein